MNGFKNFLLSLTTTVLVGVSFATPAWADIFFFSTGTPDGRLGAVPAGQLREDRDRDGR